MARKLDAKQSRELGEFVARLKALGGYASSAEWSRESGYPAPNLSELENGVAGVDGYNLLRLIRAVGARAGLSAAEAAMVSSRASGTANGVAPEKILPALRQIGDALARLDALVSERAHHRPADEHRTARAREQGQ